MEAGRRRAVPHHRFRFGVVGGFLWDQCLDLMDGVASDRNMRELKTLRSTMAV